jgi:hypothetical protein
LEGAAGLATVDFSVDITTLNGFNSTVPVLAVWVKHQGGNL